MLQSVGYGFRVILLLSFLLFICFFVFSQSYTSFKTGIS